MDLDLAERLAAASLEAGGQTRARIFLAGVHYRQGRGDEALEDLDRIHPRDERQRTETQILRVLVLFNALGRARDAEHALDAAIDQARDPDCHAWLLAMRANMLHFAGYPAEAVAIAGPLVDRADLSPRPLLAALSALGPGFALSGRGEEAVRVAERGMDPTLRAVDEVGGSINWAVGTAFLAHLVCGNLDDAGAVAVLQFETALGLRSREAHGAGATSVGWVALLRGRIATAVRFFREAEPHLRRADLFGLWPACLGGLAQGLALMGDLRGADEVLRQAEVSGRPGVRWLEFCVDRGRAWTCSIRDRSAAAGLCLKAGDIAHDRGQLPFAVLAYHDAARIGAPEQALPALREAAGHTDGPFPPAAVSHAAALATSDRAGLLEAADTFEGLGMLLIAAEAVVEAQQLGARQQDRRLAARAATLVAKCEGSITPTLADKVKRPSRLTQRELTVARLASQGHSSKAIARQLAVSVRTVDSHLARAYQKLGVVSRQELSSVLSTSGRAGSTTRRV
jgi:DNA-binding CsgD family transcriptional regulator